MAHLIMVSGTLPTISFTDLATSTANATSASFTLDVGDARGDRIILAGVTLTRFGGIVGTPSLTINGVSAARQVFKTDAPLDNSGAAIFSLLVPTGTTASFVVSSTFPFFPGGMALAVWSTTGLASSTATNTASDTNSPVAFSLPIQANGVAVACGAAPFAGAGSWTWSGITEQYDTSGLPGASGGSRVSASATTLSITGAPSSGAPTGVGASFR